MSDIFKNNNMKRKEKYNFVFGISPPAKVGGILF